MYSSDTVFLGDRPPPPPPPLPKNTVTPYYRLAGMPSNHPAAAGPSRGPLAVGAVSVQALAIRSETLAAAVAAAEEAEGGAADWREWGVELGFVGLCLALRRSGMSIALQPAATAVLLGGGGGGSGGGPPHSASAAASFRAEWDKALLAEIERGYLLSGVRRTIIAGDLGCILPRVPAIMLMMRAAGGAAVLDGVRLARDARLHGTKF